MESPTDCDGFLMSASLHIELGERGYEIHIGEDQGQRVGEVLAALAGSGRRGAVLTDRGVFAAQGEYLEGVFHNLPRLVLPVGESTKTLAQLGVVYDFLAAEGIDRAGFLFAFGGGMVGDLGGFAAASYLRGIDYYQAPTTLLAMVDSSVGGKTGINLGAGKNLAGAFYQPKTVFVDTALLRTLAPREFASGMAEVIKYGLLGDAGLFSTLRSIDRLHPEHAQLPEVIRTCCAIKARIVSEDERETAGSGGRALLNLGHTFGHAIEAVTAYGRYLHGEAIAIGLVLAAELSHRLNLIGRSEADLVPMLLTGYQLPVRLPEGLSLSFLLDAMSRDKKARKGNLRFVVLEAIGKAAVRDDVPMGLVREIWLQGGAVDD